MGHAEHKRNLIQVMNKRSLTVQLDRCASTAMGMSAWDDSLESHFSQPLQAHKRHCQPPADSQSRLTAASTRINMRLESWKLYSQSVSLRARSHGCCMSSHANDIATAPQHTPTTGLARPASKRHTRPLLSFKGQCSRTLLLEGWVLTA